MRLFLIFALFLCCQIGHASTKLLSPLVIDVHVPPGKTFTTKIPIQNSDTKEKSRVKIYQTDYVFNYEGESHYDSPGSHARSNAEWISVQSRDITIPPDTIYEHPIKVTVPKDSTLSGTYWSMIMVEMQSPMAEGDQAGLQIATQLRYGIQIVNHLGNRKEPKMTLLKKEVVYKEEKPYLHVAVENQGEDLVSPKVKLVLLDQEGGETETLEAKRIRLYPNTSKTYSFDLSQLPQRQFEVLILLDQEGEKVFGSKYNINLINKN